MVNWWVLISVWATCTQKFIAVHPLLVAIRFSILHPKGNPKQACSFQAFLILQIPWSKTLGTLGFTLGQMKMSWIEQTEGPQDHQEQRDQGTLQDEKLTSWSSGATSFKEGLEDYWDGTKVSEIRLGVPGPGDGSVSSISFIKRISSKSIPDFGNSAKVPFWIIFP